MRYAVFHFMRVITILNHLYDEAQKDKDGDYFHTYGEVRSKETNLYGALNGRVLEQIKLTFNLCRSDYRFELTTFYRLQPVLPTPAVRVTVTRLLHRTRRFFPDVGRARSHRQLIASIHRGIARLSGFW